MTGATVHVGIDGCAVIAERVADPVERQPDMAPDGVADLAGEDRLAPSRHRGTPLSSDSAARVRAMRRAAREPPGSRDDLLGEVDVLVDATPTKGGAADSLPRDLEAGVKVVVRVGTSHEPMRHAWVAQACCACAHGRDVTGVVSCDTASPARTLAALLQAASLGKTSGVLRRGNACGAVDDGAHPFAPATCAHHEGARASRHAGVSTAPCADDVMASVSREGMWEFLRLPTPGGVG